MLRLERPQALLNQTHYFPFEDDFDHEPMKFWMKQNWTTSFYIVAVYLVVIFTGQNLMQKREKFSLRRALVFWNIALSVFSIIGFSRTVPELMYVVKNYGVVRSACTPVLVENNRPLAFWGWAFVLSKVPELLDTIFIVLRKQQLISLHWYHHITVLLYTWYSATDYFATTRWFVVMNYAVHALMYAYYSVRAAGYKVPRWIAMAITIFQLAQMFVGCSVNLWAYQLIQQGEPCAVPEMNIKVSFLMYLSYVFLFSHFFYWSYFGQRSKALKKVEEKKQ